MNRSEMYCKSQHIIISGDCVSKHSDLWLRRRLLSTQKSEQFVCQSA